MLLCVKQILNKTEKQKLLTFRMYNNCFYCLIYFEDVEERLNSKKYNLLIYA